jgi:MarR family transcriptional regulator, lower aerobic nicotinate degradation pathway regulator
MANKNDDPQYGAIGTWAKRCYFAGRAMMEEALRPYGLGASQWYVLHQLAGGGPTMQRDLVRLLEVERATLSVMVAALVKKGLVEQVSDAQDQRRKRLQLTRSGEALWARLPDLTFIRDEAFEGLSQTEIETTVRVLKAATERLNRRLAGDKS